jgi:hypothetical protein
VVESDLGDGLERVVGAVGERPECKDEGEQEKNEEKRLAHRFAPRSGMGGL